MSDGDVPDYPPEDETPSDEDVLAALKARADQMIAIQGENARVAYGILECYCEAGFTRDEAMQVVMAYVYEWSS